MNKEYKCNNKKCSGFFRPLFVVVILFASLTDCFALDDARLVESIDAAFLRQSRAELSRVLGQTQSSVGYSDVESYTIKKIRESLIFNRLEYAEFASLALIEINLNNFEALDLYTRIGNALAVRREQEKQAETVRIAKLEEEKKQAEPIPESVEQEFEQRVSADGQNIYFDLSDLQRFSPINWGVNAELISLSLLSNPTETGLKYGLGISGEFYYINSILRVGAEADFTSYVITFMGEENFVTDFSIVPAIAFSNLSENLFFRVGFKGILENTVGENSFDSKFLSPSVGLEWKNIDIGNSKTRAFFDYLIGHIAIPDVKLAADVGLRTLIPISDQNTFDINMLFDVSNTAILIGNDINNNLKITIGIGVGNYE